MDFRSVAVGYQAVAAITGALLLAAARRHNRAVLDKRQVSDGLRLSRMLVGWLVVQPVVSYILPGIGAAWGLNYVTALWWIVIPSALVLAAFRVMLFWATAPLGGWSKAVPKPRFIIANLATYGMSVAMSFLTLHLYFHESVLLPLLALATVWLVYFWLGAVGVRFGRGVPIDESLPLRVEAERLLEAYGIRGKTFIVLPFTTRANAPEPMEISAQLSVWMSKFNPWRPRVPLVLLQRLEPDAVIAVLSLPLARHLAPGKPGLTAAVVWSRRILFGSFALMMTCALVPAFFTVARGGRFVYVVLVLLVLLILALLGRLVVGFLERRSDVQKQIDAFEGWRAANPNATRTPIDFMLAIITYVQVVVPGASAEQLILAHCQQPYWVGMLKHYGVAPEAARDELLVRLAPQSQETGRVES